MRKKCTNSSCRRTFSVGAENKVSCPFCRKEYPRIQPAGWSVIVEDNGRLSLAVRRVIYSRIRKDLSAAKAWRRMERGPVVVISGQSYTEACEKKLMLEEAGAKVRVARLTNRETQYYHTA